MCPLPVTLFIMAIPVLIDTDVGIDDCLALALATLTTEINLVGVAAVGGNVPLQQAWKNLCRFGQLLHWPDNLPLARGLDQIEPNLVGGTHAHGDDGLGGVKLPEPAKARQPEDIVDLYSRLICRYGRRLVIVALGPLTNLSAVQAAEPKLLRQAGQLVVMGGAVWVPGNMLNGAAEFNFYRDPVAAHEICNLSMPRLIVPLDVTRQVTVGWKEVQQLRSAPSRIANVLAEMLVYRVERGMPGKPEQSAIHDALALSTLIMPSLFVDTEVNLTVHDEPAIRGRCTPIEPREGEGAPRIAVSVVIDEIKKAILERLCVESFEV